MSTNEFDAEPELALHAIPPFAGPVMVDLDETLYLRNSTEDFLDTAVPSALAFILLKVLDLIRPWRWSGDQTRDAWRVRAICLLMPWTLLLWRRRAAKLAAQWVNKPLLESLTNAAQTKRLTVVTLGFEQIVKPLLAGFGLANTALIAMSPWRLSERNGGKLARVNGVVGAETVEQSMLVTDSLDDRDILEKCARPLRVIWPQARFISAFSGTFIPGQYVSKVKRPGQQYIYRMILREDYLFWLLASISLATNYFTHVIGLGVLLFSFWTLYEWGYYDNDQVGSKFEDDPHLSDAFEHNPVRYSTTMAWIWALGSGVAALFILRWPAYPAATDYLAWLAALLAIFGCYWIYNRIDKVSRIWLYGALRFLRVAAFAVVVPMSVVGAAALAAYTISRWVPYLTYRTAKDGWVESRLHTTWLVFFIATCVLMAFAVGWHVLWTPVTLLFLAWNVYKARYELKDYARNVHRIDKSVQE